ncbi:MAG: hybrid sensor histidine kinase/response regulator [Desulfarculaceae bacterium]|nr:hybrid sensor histidine kinase/response regulator [Desulfarculaceae bacterium]MCF8073019.1 hybrid sensor histidine kinase/response regulator [Desulfarculaceae bacterium]MCF8101896.1 hybrid sensor histidine kinase/response regulator [Desulfarculaceae bacterium]MCF8115423.1 hybrid sensor histidine kinase/response regulator [Desulfarculaceae bacterium]
MNRCSPLAYRRLLLIDDEAGIRRMMSLSLAADGYEVATAASGAEGLEIFGEQKPELVLTDIKMPGMDGIEVLKRIKQISPDTEVIIITGHGDLDVAIKSLQLQASDFVTKPINDQALAVALKRASERLALKAELRSYTEELEERVAEATAKVVANERLAAVGQTVSALVHSIKNMLAGLKGGTYMVSQGLAKEQPNLSNEGLEMLGRNIGRVQELIKDLLSISKPRAPEKAPVDLSEVVKEAAACLANEAERRGVEMVLVVPEHGGPTTSADGEMLLDAYLNLLSNAIDAAGTVTRGRVTLSCRQGMDGVCLQVQDNGPGLEPEAAQRIFQGFYSTKGAGGTGLGLMVAQKVAEEHGGKVVFESDPGSGAVFRLILPPTAPEQGQDT